MGNGADTRSRGKRYGAGRLLFVPNFVPNCPDLSGSQPISEDLTGPEMSGANGFRRILSPETRVRIPVAVPRALQVTIS
jgi:hypothetical protein